MLDWNEFFDFSRSRTWPIHHSGGGSVVTKSFPEGYVVIAGNPAKIIKYLDKDKVVMPNHTEYYGYIPKEKFNKVKSKYLDL